MFVLPPAASRSAQPQSTAVRSQTCFVLRQRPALCWHLHNGTRSILQRISCSPFPALALLAACEDLSPLCTSSNVFFILFVDSFVNCWRPESCSLPPFALGLGHILPSARGGRYWQCCIPLISAAIRKQGGFIVFSLNSAVLILLYLVNVTVKIRFNNNYMEIIPVNTKTVTDTRNYYNLYFKLTGNSEPSFSESFGNCLGVKHSKAAMGVSKSLRPCVPQSCSI